MKTQISLFLICALFFTSCVVARVHSKVDSNYQSPGIDKIYLDMECDPERQEFCEKFIEELQLEMKKRSIELLFYLFDELELLTEEQLALQQQTRLDSFQADVIVQAYEMRREVEDYENYVAGVSLPSTRENTVFDVSMIDPDNDKRYWRGHLRMNTLEMTSIDSGNGVKKAVQQLLTQWQKDKVLHK